MEGNVDLDSYFDGDQKTIPDDNTYFVDPDDDFIVDSLLNGPEIDS